ncbi:MAG: hypothetical protein IT193_11440 [Propionibacteriaceae bacterium]|nr:hypothetical protein [Propionibacteriaceae bacterium]
MTNESYERNLSNTADRDPGSDPRLESDDLVAGGGYPDPGTGAMGLDDTQPTAANSDQLSTGSGYGTDDEGLTGNRYGSDEEVAGSAAGAGQAWPTGAAASGSGGGGAVGQAGQKAGAVAGSAADKAADIKDAALTKAADVKDVAVERGGDVAAVAKDELARLASDARSQVQALWSDASEQLRGQAASGQHQAAELLHSLAGELGEMASKSENGGPLTALAKQAAARGGELSHWLANSEPADVLTELRRFARRRPFVFLAGAALAGVVVGRLGRGLMAANEPEATGSARSSGSSAGSVPATAGVVTPPPVTYEEVPSFGTGEAPEEPQVYSSQPGLTDPYGYGGGAR